MKKVDKIVSLDNLIATDNVRLPGGQDIVDLAHDIGANGLQVRIEVASPYKDNGVPEGQYLTMRGHRRREALHYLKDHEPNIFEAKFGKGVPVTVFSGLTEHEILDRKVDHGNELALGNMFEVLLSAIMLFTASFTEKSVAMKLSGLLNRLNPMKPGKKKKIQELEAKKAEAKGDEAIKLGKEIEEINLAYRRGSVQLLHNFYRLPRKVTAAYFRKCTGSMEGCDKVGLGEFTKVPMPQSITTSQVTGLFKALKDDLDVKENGVSKFGKRQPGPNFNAKWDEIIAADIEKAANPDDPRPKAMSGNDMKKELDDGKYSSKLARMVTAHHTGSKEVSGKDIATQDLIAYYAELIAENDGDEWDVIVDKAKAIEAVEIEKAASKEPATAAA